ncbi:MAG: hypothetical protein V3S44_09185 [Alphaproteobacteria bacterium]
MLKPFRASGKRSKGAKSVILPAASHFREASFIFAHSLSYLAFFRGALALVMVVAGTLHFVATDAYVAIMPDYLPLHRELVYLSGVFEIMFGLGLLVRRTRGISGICLILLYLAVLPANINMAVQNIQPAEFDIPAFLLWARLPLQLVLIYWAWVVSRPDRA